MSFKDRVRIYEGKYPHVWIECKSVEQANELVKEIECALKLQEIFNQDLVDWKSSSEMKVECGYAMMQTPFITEVYSVLKSMEKRSHE